MLNSCTRFLFLQVLPDDLLDIGGEVELVKRRDDFGIVSAAFLVKSGDRPEVLAFMIPIQKIGALEARPLGVLISAGFACRRRYFDSVQARPEFAR